MCVYIYIYIHNIHLFTGATEDLFCQEELKKLLEAAPCPVGDWRMFILDYMNTL